MSLISLQDAGFDYGRETILRGANLNVLPGVKYALVGANGAGKTTLLSLLAGELPLNAGSRQARSGLRLRWLRQSMVLADEGGEDRPLVRCVEREAFAEELALEADLSRLSGALAAAVDGGERDRLARDRGMLQTEFERRDGYIMRPRL